MSYNTRSNLDWLAIEYDIVSNLFATTNQVKKVFAEQSIRYLDFFLKVLVFHVLAGGFSKLYSLKVLASEYF